jgi:hypothetical protein
MDWAYETCDAPYRFVIKAQDRGDITNLLGELEVLFRMNFLKAISAPKGTGMIIASSPADAFRRLPDGGDAVRH